MQLLYILPLFLGGAACSSLLTFLGTLHPVVGTIGRSLFVVILVLLVAAFILDDAIHPLVKMDQIQYYATVIGAALALILGVLVVWLL